MTGFIIRRIKGRSDNIYRLITEVIESVRIVQTVRGNSEREKCHCRIKPKRKEKIANKGFLQTSVYISDPAIPQLSIRPREVEINVHEKGLPFAVIAT